MKLSLIKWKTSWCKILWKCFFSNFIFIIKVFIRWFGTPPASISETERFSQRTTYLRLIFFKKSELYLLKFSSINLNFSSIVWIFELKQVTLSFRTPTWNGLLALRYLMPFIDLLLYISKFGILIKLYIVLALLGEININNSRIIFKNFIRQYRWKKRETKIQFNP